MEIKTALTALLLCLGAQASFAQSADELVQKYAKAVGADAANKIKTMSISATIGSQGNEFPENIQVINHKAVYTKVSMMGTDVLLAYKDGSGWKMNPFVGSTSPASLTDEETQNCADQAEIAGGLAGYKARGEKVESLGKETVEGVSAYKVKWTRKNQAVEYYFLNADTYLPVKRTVTRKLVEENLDMDQVFGDYRNVAGFSMPFETSTKMGGQEYAHLRIDKVEPNVAIDEGIFAMPE